MTLKVGDVVVAFHGKYPVMHNSKEFPDHSCRGTILKVGRLNYKVSTIGAPMTVKINAKPWDKDNTFTFSVLPIEEAKKHLRTNFGGPNEWRTSEFIDRVIESL